MALDMMFSDEHIDVDLKTFPTLREFANLYGTMAKKGAKTQIDRTD